MNGTSCPTNPPAHGVQAQYYNNAAALYADPKIRLHYPPELFQRVYAFAGPVTDAALDVATGTGQCARQLASTYQQVWAVEASEEQLKHCEALPNITFRQGCAESTGLPSHSVDLVTVATALRWFDVPAFYREARRVLKQGGTLAAWGYYFPEILKHPGADGVLRDFTGNMLGPHKTEVHYSCERQYRGLEPSREEFGVIQWDTLPCDVESTVWHLVQFIRTAGLYAKMRQERPGKPDPLPKLQRDLMSSLGTSDERMPLTLRYKVFMMMAKAPKPV